MLNYHPGNLKTHWGYNKTILKEKLKYFGNNLMPLTQPGRSVCRALRVSALHQRGHHPHSQPAEHAGLLQRVLLLGHIPHPGGAVVAACSQESFFITPHTSHYLENMKKSSNAWASFDSNDSAIWKSSIKLKKNIYHEIVK